jgi:YfiH family protein
VNGVLATPFYELDGQIAIDLPGARAVFTTASWGDVRETHAEIATRLGVSLARARQVHGSTVIQTKLVPCGQMTEADAVATSTAGIAPMVISADCVPIVIAGGGAVAAVHAGWKGLRDGVIESAVAAVRRMSSQAEPELSAAIGPCAGACCYEVSEELHETFAQHEQDFRNGQNLDLNAIARQQLTELGVKTIHDLALCTICSEPDQLFSYRRDQRETGRQGALIWLT